LHGNQSFVNYKISHCSQWLDVNAEGGCPKIAKIECPVSAEKDVQLCSNAKVIPLKFDIESLWDRQKRTRERVRLAG